MNMNLSYSKYLLGMAIIGVGFTTASCSKSEGDKANAGKTEVVADAAKVPEEKILNIYNWSDYLAEDTIPNFETT